MDFERVDIVKKTPQTLDVFFAPSQGKLGHKMIAMNQKNREGMPEPFCDLVHVGVVSDWPKGIHSTVSGGVHVIENIAEMYPDAVILRHKDLIEPWMSGVRNQIRGDLLERCAKKQKYDMLGIMRFPLMIIPTLLRWIGKKFNAAYDELRVFCSELVVRALRKRGITVVDSIDPECISPGRLAMDENFVYVGKASDFPCDRTDVSGDIELGM